MPTWSRAPAPTARILTGIDAFDGALEQLKPERIAGAGGLATRHDAMLAAEAGADYVMFGEPDATDNAAGLRGHRGARRLVGGSVRDTLRRLCRARSRDRAAGGSRRRFHRARRLALARSADDCGDDRATPRAICACRRRRHERGAAVICWLLHCRRCCVAPALAQPANSAARHRRRHRPRRQQAAERRSRLMAPTSAAIISPPSPRRPSAPQQNDPAAMTLLGELYAQGLGVGRDDAKAAQWYKLAAEHGDRDAMFALAMFNFEGRAGRATDEARASARARPPSSATPAPPTISACSICRASSSRRTSSAPPNCSRVPPTPAIRKRNTRSPPCTRKAAACRRTSTKRCG